MKLWPQIAPVLLRFPFPTADLSGQKLVKVVQSTAIVKEHGQTEVQSKVILWSSHVKKHKHWTQCLNTCPEGAHEASCISLLNSVILSPIVYIPYSAPFFLHYLECTLHAFTPQTFVIYLHLQHSDSVTLVPVWGLEHRPFKYIWQTILVFIQKTRKTTSPTEDKLFNLYKVAEAPQQLTGILNREEPKWACEFQTSLLPRVFCIILNKIIKPPPPPMQKPNVAVSCHSWFVFQWHRYPPLPCQCVPKSGSVIGCQTEACPHAQEQDFSAQVHKVTSRPSS